MQVIQWADAAEAREADELLLDGPCSPECEGRHLVVFAAPSRGVVCLPGCHDKPAVPADLGAALAVCYPSKRNGHATLETTPALWPRPRALNEPLTERSRHR